MKETYITGYKILQPPKYVGGYKVGDNFHIALIKKPAWLHRKFTRIILGWNWIDYD